MRRAPKSLKRRLTVRMIVIQMMSIGGFFGFVVFPQVVYPVLVQIGSARTMDPSMAGVFAGAIVGVDGDRIVLDQQSELAGFREEFPESFFYAETASGASVTLGPLPEAANIVIPYLAQIDKLEMHMRELEAGSFLVRYEDSAVGRVHVLAGNGPTFWVVGLLRNAALGLAVSISLVLTLASALAIPLLVHRELRGVDDIAEDARRIDIDRRGVRLGETGVPLEIVSLVKAVNAALARLDQAYAGRERFLADAAHEIRTPIAILQMRLEESTPFTERNRLLLDVARLGSIAEQLLDLQRLDRATEMSEIVDMHALAEGVVGDLAPLAIASGYEISLSDAPEPLLVRGDQRSLYRAIANLVQNAIAYGGGKGEILVEIDPRGQVWVSDQGSGVPEQERERIFEPFHRLHRRDTGSGLGLNLVQAIMAHHGGTAFVEEAAGGGARFVLEFPRPGAEKPIAPAAQG